MLPIVRSVLASVFCLSVVVPAEAALMGRLPATPGGTDYQAAYDDVLKITWLTDAGLSGTGTWGDQLDWVSALNNENHLGFNDWRLALMSVTAPAGSQPATTKTTTSFAVFCSSVSETVCRDNELGYMFYHNLGGGFLDDLSGEQTVGMGMDAVTLTDIQSYYWSGTESYLFDAWHTDFSGGGQGIASKYLYDDLSGWAVRSGDVAAVPVPAAVWLFGSGILGLIGFSKRKKAAA